MRVNVTTNMRFRLIAKVFKQRAVWDMGSHRNYLVKIVNPQNTLHNYFGIAIIEYII